MTEQQKLTFNMLQQQLDSLMLRDRQRFARRLHGVKKVKNPDAQQAIYQEMAKEIELAAGKVVLREAARPEIRYPENLPVSQKKQDILEAIRDHQVVIVAGETGSESHQLPKICMELGRGVKGLIGHTQPRRLAARTVANRIAEELQPSRAAVSVIRYVSAIMSVITPWSSCDGRYPAGRNPTGSAANAVRHHHHR